MGTKWSEKSWDLCSQLRLHFWFRPVHLELTAWQGLHIYTFIFQEFFLFHIFTYRDKTLSVLHFDFQRQHSLSLYLVTQLNTCNMGAYTFYNLFLILPFRLDSFQPWTQPQKFRQTPKETNNQHGRRHVPPWMHCGIFVYRYLAWNTLSTYI